MIIAKIINNNTFVRWSVHIYLWSERFFSGTGLSEISRKSQVHNVFITKFQKPVNGNDSMKVIIFFQYYFLSTERNVMKYLKIVHGLSK